MINFNDIKRFCTINKLTLRDFAEASGIQYDRVYRLAHSTNLLQDLKVSELGQITEAFPSFLLNY